MADILRHDTYSIFNDPNPVNAPSGMSDILFLWSLLIENPMRYYKLRLVLNHSSVLDIFFLSQSKLT